MIVYGDVVRRERPADKLAHVRTFLGRAAAAPIWIERHQALVSALIEAGELAQSLADAAAERPDLSAASNAAQVLTFELARVVHASWSDDRPSGASMQAVRAAFPEIAVDEELTIKQPESFGFYCLYPESFSEAARSLSGRPVQMVGLRSIGTTLSAMAAAGAGAPCPVTVRPAGHPFSRVLSDRDSATVAALVEPGARYGIVDEGPGASGSSVAAVAKALIKSGASPDGIHLFPSHANGPGAHATDCIRRFWQGARTELVTFDDLVLRAALREHRLESWVEDLVGQPIGPLEELSGGAWRAARRIPEAEWPPVHPWQERRKFLLRTASGAWLLRFAGLGRSGEAKLARARRLSGAGFVPEVAGWRHGFMIERWREDVRPLRPAGEERARFLGHLGRYLALRAREFPTGHRGASIEELWEMSRANAGEAFGPAATEAFERLCPALPRLQAVSHPVETDSRLHVWEWLVTREGAFLKTDALDHFAGHDLVGPQDIAWDIAGASIEFGLSESELDGLKAGVQDGSGRPVSDQLISFLRPCYAGFWLGSYHEAAVSSGDPREVARLVAAKARYGEAFGRVLSET